MLTVEYRVNGQLIGNTNIHNTGNINSDGFVLYTVVHLTPIQGESHLKNIMATGTVLHRPEDGFTILVKKALDKITEEME